MADQLDAPGVSAEDLVAVVRVHVDRVHDAVRRLGCGPRAAVDVVETSALDLVDVVAAHPETVPDAVGWWFARARALGHEAAAGIVEPPVGHGLLAVDAEQARLAEALEDLPEEQRVPLLLRDSYDLPPTSVGAALGVDADAAMALVARARLALLPLLDDAPAPDLPAHQEDPAALARLGEGPPVAARDAGARRHALSCEGCRRVVDAQERAHLLLAGLTVVALDDAEREALLSRLEQASSAALPTRSALVLRGREGDQAAGPARTLTPGGALLAIALAVALGVGAGLVLSRDRQAVEPVGAQDPLPPGVALVSPPPEPTAAPASPPTVTAPAPATSVFIVPSPSPSPAPPAPSAPPSPAPPGEELGIALDPTSGPNGQTIAVVGVGWPPGGEVAVDYLDSLGEPTGSRATAVADAQGRFRTELAALDPSNVPGPHAVLAVADDAQAEATYEVQD